MVYQEKTSKDVRNFPGNISLINKLTFTIVTALVLILPWFFNNQISNQVETSKNIIIGISISFLLLMWAVNLFKHNELAWFATPIDKAILIILFSALLSTVFSIHQETSIWGYNLNQTGSFMSLCSILILFIITFQNLRDTKAIIRIVKLLPFSLSLYALFTFLKANNILENSNQVLSLGIDQLNPLLDQLVSPAGDIKALTSLFILVLPISLFVLIDKRNASSFERAIGFVISAVLILAIFTNIQSNADLFFKAITCSLVIAIIIFALIYSVKLKNRVSLSIILNFILLGASIIGSLITINTPSQNELAIPLETTTSIITGIVNEDPARLIFGTGLDTYGYAFTKFRPETQNLNPDWFINHTKGNSQFEDIMINTGLMGIIGLGILTYYILKFIAVRVLKARLHSQNSLILALSTATILFLLSYFFSIHSILLSFFGWLIIALLFLCYANLDPNKVKKYSIELKLDSKLHPKQNFAPKLLSLVIAIIGFTVLTFSIKNLMSEIYFQQTLFKISNGQYEDANNDILTAIKINAGKDYYYSELASILMERLNSHVQTSENNSPVAKDPIVLNLVTEISGALTKAIQLNAVDYRNWQAASILNKQLYELLHEPKYEQNALQFIEQALMRYRTGPDNYLLLAELYEIGTNPQKTDLAEAAYTKAYSLQPSYIISIMRLGIFLEKENKKDLALSLYSISKQEFYPTESDFNSYLNSRIAALKNDFEE